MKVWWMAMATATAAVVIGGGSTAGAAPLPEAGGQGSPFLRCDGGVIGAARLEAHVARGGRILCDGATVLGAVDLTSIGNVRNLLVCTNCRFKGRIEGRHVVFERGLDLTGAVFEGAVGLRGARFVGPALFGSPPSADSKLGVPRAARRTAFGKAADLSFATFEDLAVFEGAGFRDTGNFSSARFRGPARFGYARFGAAVSFPAASFARESSFAHARFRADATFAGALFGGPADFRDGSFGLAANFTEATFAERADFSKSYMSETLFRGAHFGAGASFNNVRLGPTLGSLDLAEAPALLSADEGKPLLSFDNAAVNGPLTFKDAKLFGDVQLTSVSAREIVIEQAEFDGTSGLYLTDAAAGALSMSPEVLEKHLRDEREPRLTALRVLEATAKADGDLGRANDARYRIQVLESADDWWPRRIGDAALYRWVAGYFVEPLRPILWLLAVIFAAALLRAVHRKGERERVEPPPQPGRLARAANRFAVELAYTITPRGDKDQKPPVRRLELTVYAALLGCFVLSLANTNPTLREMVEGLV